MFEGKEYLKKVDDFCYELNKELIDYKIGFGKSYSCIFSYIPLQKRIRFKFEWISIRGHYYNTYYYLPCITFNVEEEIKITKERISEQLMKWIETDQNRIL